MTASARTTDRTADPAVPLALRDVTVRVPDGDETLTILDGVSLEVGRGEAVVIHGRSGSGKSTLLAVAGLLRRPDEGGVAIADQPTDGLSPRQRTRLRGAHVGIVYQSAQLFPTLRAVEQLELVAHVQGRLDGDARRRARDLLGEVGLGHRLDHRPGHLSGGERQRLGLARALMAEPSVLLADEPTAALDPERAAEVMELVVAETTERRLATVIVSHDQAHGALVDRAYDLRSGRLHPVVGAVAG